MRAAIIPRVDPVNRASYEQQFDDACRNVEIATEGLGRLIRRHPRKATLVLRVVADWLYRYFSCQKAAIGSPRYLVYTELDRQIPFVPAEDILYTYMIAQIA